MTHGSVLVQGDGSVTVLTMNRPEKRNAIDLDLAEALADALESAMADESTRAVVLTGAGPVFCAGGDISTMGNQPAEEARARVEAGERVVRAILQGSTPVVAAVQGSAFGAGVALAAACDRVVAGSDCIFHVSFTGVGLSGDMGVFASLPARVGLARARQLLMFPTPVDGPEALKIGLIDSVVEPGTALMEARTDADLLAAGPPLALAAIKDLLRDCPRDPIEVIEREVDAMERLFQTEDHAEGAAAFHERRPPRFRGR
jgi:2-(1,2-epoxy-1,2-dihydrophenyl)acetyl-CoA isomerase